MKILFDLGSISDVTGKVDLGNHEVYYELSNNSDTPTQTFLLIHGAAATGRYMNLVARTLLEQIPECRVINIDLPNHGLSTSKPGYEITHVNEYAEVTHEFIQAVSRQGLIIGDLTLVGWSMGGSIGILLALVDDLVDKLVLMNTSPYWDTVDGMVQMEGFKIPEQANATFKHIITTELAGVALPEVAELLENLDKITADGKTIIRDFNCLTTDKYDVRDKLKDVHVPTVVFSGVDDALTNAEVQQFMADNIPQTSLVLVDNKHSTVLFKEDILDMIDGITDLDE